MALKLIIFDVGGTIIENDDFDFIRGVKYLYDEVLDVKDSYEDYLKHVDELKTVFEYRFDTKLELSFDSYLNYLILRYGKKKDISNSEIELKYYECIFDKRLVDGVVDILDYLKETGYPLQVFSNSMFSTNAVKNELKSAGIDHYFDNIVSSGDHLFRKPSEYIFDAYLKRYNLKPEEAMYIGNDYNFDIVSPVKLGMKCALRGEKMQMHDGYLEFDTYKNLIKWFKDNG